MQPNALIDLQNLLMGEISKMSVCYQYDILHTSEKAIEKCQTVAMNYNISILSSAYKHLETKCVHVSIYEMIGRDQFQYTLYWRNKKFCLC